MDRTANSAIKIQRQVGRIAARVTGVEPEAPQPIFFGEKSEASARDHA
jgi:hypothetical protein